MKTVAFVSIKMNNERLPEKNTKCFSDEKSVIEYILNTLFKVNGIDEREAEHKLAISSRMVMYSINQGGAAA